MCDCGKLIFVPTGNLNNGNSKSCGCWNREIVLEKTTKHGLSNSRLENTYIHMIRRCYKEHEKAYPNYGGRGIKVCDEWLNDRIKFYNWAMENGYSDNLTLDRINNNGNYEPSNCRWVDMSVQTNNTRRNNHITFKGIKKTLGEWATISGINYTTLMNRTDYLLNWDNEDLFNEVRPRKDSKMDYSKVNKIILCGNISGAGKDTVADYICKNYDFEKVYFAEGVYEIAKKYFGMKQKKDRDLLQKIGMKMREIDELIWIKYVIDKSIKFLRKDKKVIISDMRFFNEYDIMTSLNFIPIRVICDRDIAIQRIIARDGVCDESLLDNKSETETRNFEMLEISNNGSLEELYNQIDKLILTLRK